jgi:hypothetical protein
MKKREIVASDLQRSGYTQLLIPVGWLTNAACPSHDMMLVKGDAKISLLSPKTELTP